MSEMTNSAKRMIARAQKISDPALRDKKIKDARRLSFLSKAKPSQGDEK